MRASHDDRHLSVRNRGGGANQTGTLLIGADAEFLFDTGGAADTNTLSTFNDRIELRIDPAPTRC
jgi:hypothetical protein